MGPDVESLLDREARAALPLGRQLMLYLNPFALFKDASRGNVLVRQAALSYNRAMRWVLVTYLRRWALIAGLSFLCIAPGEALAAQSPIFLIPTAAIAVGFCIAVAVIATTAAAWLLLGVSRDH
ncbi:MAG TPA: hypothetical protein VD965_07485 [Burkholderiales bacterium]|nr:hypothetical protein [Burkholderiales bacterium]